MIETLLIKNSESTNKWNEIKHISRSYEAMSNKVKSASHIRAALIKEKERKKEQQKRKCFTEIKRRERWCKYCSGYDSSHKIPSAPTLNSEQRSRNFKEVQNQLTMYLYSTYVHSFTWQRHDVHNPNYNLINDQIKKSSIKHLVWFKHYVYR